MIRDSQMTEVSVPGFGLSGLGVSVVRDLNVKQGQFVAALRKADCPI